MAVRLLQNSYLRFSDLYKANGFTFFDVPDWPDFKQQDDDINVTVDRGYVNRPDLIAFDQYGDPELFWVLCLANNINVPPTGFYLNRTIRVPSLRYVKQVIRGSQ